jgi:hypothetical protein
VWVNNVHIVSGAWWVAIVSGFCLFALAHANSNSEVYEQVWSNLRFSHKDRSGTWTPFTCYSLGDLCMVSQEKELVALASASDPAALGNSSAPGLLASPVLLSPGALEAVAHLRALPFKKRHGWAEPSRPRGDDGVEQAEPSNVVVDDDDDGDSATAAELALLQHDAIPERLQHDEHTPRFKWRSVCELSPLQQPDASARPGTFKWKTIDVPQGPGGRPAPPTLGNSILAQPPLKPPQGPSPAPFASGLMMPPPAPPGMAPGMARAVQLPMLPQVQPSVRQPSVPQPSVPQPSVLQPSVPQPSVLQPSVLQPSVLQPSVSQPSSVLQPSVSQPSSVLQPPSSVLQPSVLLQMPLAPAPRVPPPPPIMAPIMAPVRALAMVAPKAAKWLPLAPKESKARPKLGSAKGSASQLASADQESSARRPTVMAGVSSSGAVYLPAAPMALAVGGIILGPNLGPSPLQFQWVHVNMAPKMAPAVTAQDEADRPDAQHGAASTISSVISSEPPAKKPRKSCKELCEVPAAQEAGPMLLPQPLNGLEAQGQVVPLAVVMRLKGSRLLDLPAPTSQAQLVLSPARMVRLRLRGVHNIRTSTLRQRPSAAHQ